MANLHGSHDGHEHEISHRDNEREENERIDEIREQSRRDTENFAFHYQQVADDMASELLHSESFLARSDDASERVQRDYQDVVEISDYFKVDPDVEYLNDILGINYQQPAPRRSLLQRFIAWFFGFMPRRTAASRNADPAADDDGTYTLFAYMIRLSKGEPTDDFQTLLTESLRKSTNELFTAWQQQSDDDFWIGAAKYQAVDSIATLMDHVYFCQFTKQLAASADLWIWDTKAEQDAIVATLVTLYEQSPDATASVLYTNVARQTYQGRKLPRDVAADVVELALARILRALPV